MAIYFNAEFIFNKQAIRKKAKVEFHKDNYKSIFYVRDTVLFFFKHWTRKAVNVESWVDDYKEVTMCDDEGESKEVKKRIYFINYWTLEKDFTAFDEEKEFKLHNASILNDRLDAHLISARNQLFNEGEQSLADRSMKQKVDYVRGLNPVAAIQSEKKKDGKK